MAEAVPAGREIGALARAGCQTDAVSAQASAAAVLATASARSWLLRTGSLLLGRANSLRFYRQICRRVRRLMGATHEARRVAVAA